MDEKLERAIDTFGREKVFQRAHQLGWGAETPPAWVWWGIVGQLAQESLRERVSLGEE